MDLKNIKDPHFLKTLSLNELDKLADDIRKCILNTVSIKGGHLSSNLGSVESTIALHTVFDAPYDKILFDVGHQCYTHKILTGRYDEFVSSLREKDGLSGYQKRSESIYDCFEAGHSSTSISAAMGMKKAMMINHDNHDVIAYIGDSSISSGMAFEALNNLASFDGKVIVLLNDNGMAISKPTGGLSLSLSRIRSTFTYNHTKSKLKKILCKVPLGNYIYRFLRKIKNIVKGALVGSNVFENINLNYIGPIDGHNIKHLIKAFKIAKNSKESTVIHVVTKKGYGYLPSENDENGIWHGVGKFNIEDGTFISNKKEGYTSWSQAISNIMYDLMQHDENIVTITPAMIEGSKLRRIATDFPDRFYDVNIAEEHAATFASGMALGGIKPYLTIYATFMQRAYDQISHDIARMNNHVVIGVDRAGLVGADGETHQGIYDVAMLKSIPGIVIAQPKDMMDAKVLYNTAFNASCPFVIRYPREDVKLEDVFSNKETISIGTWDEDKSVDAKLNVIVTGCKYNELLKFKKDNNLAINLYFARFYNPLDYNKLDDIFSSNLDTIIYDSYATNEALYASICEYAMKKEAKNKLINRSIPNKFIKHATIEQQLIDLKLDLGTISEEIVNALRQNSI